jgi:hypothetical protein
MGRRVGQILPLFAAAAVCASAAAAPQSRIVSVSAWGASARPLSSSDVEFPPPCRGFTATIVGTDGADVISGTAGNDVIVGLGGDDTIDGMGGDDQICGGDGNDTLNGGDGRDALDGGNGADHLDGGPGDDSVEGNAGDDVADGGDGNDFVDGGVGGCCDPLTNTGDDRLDGGPGDDDIWSADFGRMIAHGGGGSDHLHGLNGNDELWGDGGDDTLDGGGGSDTLNGGEGVDHLFGLAGDDLLDTRDGVAGNDSADGGDGSDQCRIDGSEAAVQNCETVVPLRALTVSLNGSGSVTSTPAGIDCGSRCSAEFDAGTTVTLTASAAAGSEFSTWGGACLNSSGPCVVTLDTDKSVSALFAPVVPPPVTPSQLLSVSKTGSGSGSVTSTPAGIDCGSICSASFERGASVTLSAKPATGSTFGGWSGACSETTGDCVVVMRTDASATAHFDAGGTTSAPAGTPSIEGGAASEPPQEVTVATANPADAATVAQVAAGVTGNGIIKASLRGLTADGPAGIICGFNAFRCYTRVKPGQRVELRAQPLPGYRFIGWTGPCAGKGAVCVIIARALTMVTALFAPRNPAATVGLDVHPLRVQIRWHLSRGSGLIKFSGRIGGAGVLRIQLRRPGGGPLLTRRITVRPGGFQRVIPLRQQLLPRGARVLPGAFALTVKGSSGGASLPFQLQPLLIPAPVEGVVRRAFPSAIENGPTTNRLPRGATIAWANFNLATQPSSRLPVSVTWYWPDGKRLGSIQKNNRPQITSYITLSKGLPPGRWTAELDAGAKKIKRLTIRIG